MAGVVKALALLVQIAPVGVRVPAVAATKMDIGVTPPPPRRWPNSPTGHEWKTSKMIAELRLDDKKKKKKKKIMQNTGEKLLPSVVTCFTYLLVFF